jgi:hypothetical protein
MVFECIILRNVCVLSDVSVEYSRPYKHYDMSQHPLYKMRCAMSQHKTVKCHCLPLDLFYYMALQTGKARKSIHHVRLCSCSKF